MKKTTLSNLPIGRTILIIAALILLSSYVRAWTTGSGCDMSSQSSCDKLILDGQTQWNTIDQKILANQQKQRALEAEEYALRQEQKSIEKNVEVFRTYKKIGSSLSKTK